MGLLVVAFTPLRLYHCQLLMSRTAHIRNVLTTNSNSFMYHNHGEVMRRQEHEACIEWHTCR